MNVREYLERFRAAEGFEDRALRLLVTSKVIGKEEYQMYERLVQEAEINNPQPEAPYIAPPRTDADPLWAKMAGEIRNSEEYLTGCLAVKELLQAEIKTAYWEERRRHPEETILRQRRDKARYQKELEAWQPRRQQALKEAREAFFERFGILDREV